MKTTILTSLAIVVLMCATAQAQWTKVPPPAIPRTADGKPNLSAPAPRLPDGKPDLSGVWEPRKPNGCGNLAADLKPEDVPFQPWAKALYDERAACLHWREEPDANCLPQGTPKILVAPAPWKIVQTPTFLVFVHEAFNLWLFTFSFDKGPRSVTLARLRQQCIRVCLSLQYCTLAACMRQEQ